MIRNFEDSDIAERYNKYRPGYPSIIRKVIFDRVEGSKSTQPRGFKKFSAMLDVACGSGQNTHLFAPYFDSILGIDISPYQISVAEEKNKNENVKFQQVDNNLFPLEDNSVDVVTCATAAHYLDIPTFESECMRVLRPGGCATGFCYNLECVNIWNSPIDVKSEFQKIYTDFEKNIGHEPRFRTYWEKYRSAFEQIKTTSKVIREDLWDVTEYTLAQFESYCRTFGDYHTFIKEGRAINEDPLEVFISKLKDLLEVQDVEDEKIKLAVTHSYSMFIFSK